MIQRDRRTLSFPAVHPCEGISPPTLVASLITLSQSICNYQPESFPIPTQRRNARETIRQIGIVLMFLQEVSQIPHSAILCLAELHFTLQKIQFFMQDCALQPARLLMLAKSQHLASQFRLLIRAVATSLDVLPLHNFHVSCEVRELAELVTKQARKAKFEVDPSDIRASKTLHTILRHFARGIEPDLSSIKEIIDYLEIRTRTDCNREIKFLEEEINLECEEKEVPLLCALVGFLTYCRGVLFETIQDSDHSKGRCSTEMTALNITSVNPEDFRCPISLELMKDPVTVSTGQTYDRDSIHKWLKAGNTTCPKTGEKLTNTELVPNATLKRLIQQLCADNGTSLSSSCNRNRNIVAGSPAAAHAMQFLAWFLTRRLVLGTEEQKHKAAYEIRVLARTSIFNRACLIEMGVVPLLLDLLSSGSANDKSTQENTISALLKLSKHPNGPKSIINSRGINAILSVLKSGLTLEARQVAAATIFYLSSVKEYRKSIGENPEAIPALVELVKEGSSWGRKNAVVAILGLLLLPKNHERVLAAGAVPALLDILYSSENEELIAECLAVLAALAENVEGARALQGSSLPLMIEMLRSATSRAGKEHCASILLSLCVNVGLEVVAVLAKDPSLMPLLYSLLTEGNSHASKKARFLVKVIQDFKETRTSGLKSFSPPQEPSLHVW